MRSAGVAAAVWNYGWLMALDRRQIPAGEVGEIWTRLQTMARLATMELCLTKAGTLPMVGFKTGDFSISR
jgi:hypothetical protein